MLGQRADWQTVWSLYLLTTSLTLSYVGPMGSLTFSQGGLSATAAIPHQMQLWMKNLNRTQSAQLVKGSVLCRRQDARSVSESFRSSMAARDRVFCLMEALGLCTTEAQVPSRAPTMYWIGFSQFQPRFICGTNKVHQMTKVQRDLL
jgi:hypothetical protein